MKFRVNWTQVKTTQAGKEYKTATILDESNAEFSVSVWPDFSKYADVQAGREVEGKILEKGQYKNLVDDKAQGGGNRTAVMTKLMDRKDKSIEGFQDNKELGIKTSSTIRMAVDCAIAEFTNGKSFTYGQTLGENIIGWRKWFLSHWDFDVTDINAF